MNPSNCGGKIPVVAEPLAREVAVRLDVRAGRGARDPHGLARRFVSRVGRGQRRRGCERQVDQPIEGGIPVLLPPFLRRATAAPPPAELRQRRRVGQSHGLGLRRQSGAAGASRPPAAGLRRRRPLMELRSAASWAIVRFQFHAERASDCCDQLRFCSARPRIPRTSPRSGSNNMGSSAAPIFTLFGNAQHHAPPVAARSARG